MSKQIIFYKVFGTVKVQDGPEILAVCFKCCKWLPGTLNQRDVIPAWCIKYYDFVKSFQSSYTPPKNIPNRKDSKNKPYWWASTHHIVRAPLVEFTVLYQVWKLQHAPIIHLETEMLTKRGESQCLFRKSRNPQNVDTVLFLFLAFNSLGYKVRIEVPGLIQNVLLQRASGSTSPLYIQNYSTSVVARDAISTAVSLMGQQANWWNTGQLHSLCPFVMPFHAL